MGYEDAVYPVSYDKLKELPILLECIHDLELLELRPTCELLLILNLGIYLIQRPHNRTVRRPGVQGSQPTGYSSDYNIPVLHLRPSIRDHIR